MSEIIVPMWLCIPILGISWAVGLGIGLLCGRTILMWMTRERR